MRRTHTKMILAVSAILLGTAGLSPTVYALGGGGAPPPPPANPGAAPAVTAVEGDTSTPGGYKEAVYKAYPNVKTAIINYLDAVKSKANSAPVPRVGLKCPEDKGKDLARSGNLNDRARCLAATGNKDFTGKFLENMGAEPTDCILMMTINPANLSGKWYQRKQGAQKQGSFGRKANLCVKNTFWNNFLQSEYDPLQAKN